MSDSNTLRWAGSASITGGVALFAAVMSLWLQIAVDSWRQELFQTDWMTPWERVSSTARLIPDSLGAVVEIYTIESPLFAAVSGVLVAVGSALIVYDLRVTQDD